MRKNGIVPLTVECISYEQNRCHLRIRLAMSWLVDVCVEMKLHSRSRRCRSLRNQLDDNLMADQGPTAAVLNNEGEELIFDLVPLACAG